MLAIRDMVMKDEEEIKINGEIEETRRSVFLVRFGSFDSRRLRREGAAADKFSKFGPASLMRMILRLRMRPGNIDRPKITTRSLPCAMSRW